MSFVRTQLARLCISGVCTSQRNNQRYRHHHNHYRNTAFTNTTLYPIGKATCPYCELSGGLEDIHHIFWISAQYCKKRHSAPNHSQWGKAGYVTFSFQLVLLCWVDLHIDSFYLCQLERAQAFACSRFTPLFLYFLNFLSRLLFFFSTHFFSLIFSFILSFPLAAVSRP